MPAIETSNKTTIQGHTAPLGSRPVCSTASWTFPIGALQIPPINSIPPGAFAASVNGFISVQASGSEACVASWDTLVTHSYPSVLPPDLPESLVLQPHWSCDIISPAGVTHLPSATVAPIIHPPQSCQTHLSETPNTSRQFLASNSTVPLPSHIAPRELEARQRSLPLPSH